MASYENLSREELLKLLEKTEKKPQNPATVKQCEYRSLRGDRMYCISEATTPYGFCRKHANTVQATRARVAYEAKNARPDSESESVEEETQEDSSEKEEEVTPPPTRKARSPSPVRKARSPPPTRKRVEYVERPSQSRHTEEHEERSKPAKTHEEHEKPKRTLKIRKNEFGNYEDRESNIVFNSKALVIGYQDYRTGKVKPLTRLHLKICYARGWKVLDEDD